MDGLGGGAGVHRFPHGGHVTVPRAPGVWHTPARWAVTSVLLAVCGQPLKQQQCAAIFSPPAAQNAAARRSLKNRKMCRHRPVHPPSRRPRDRLRRPRGVGQAAVRRGRSIGSERASSYRTELGRRWSARDGARPPFRCYGCSDDSSAPRASQRSRSRGRRPPPRPVVLLPVGGAARSTRRTITAAAAAPPPSHVNTIIARSARRTRSSSTYRDDVPHKDLAS